MIFYLAPQNCLGGGAFKKYRGLGSTARSPDLTGPYFLDTPSSPVVPRCSQGAEALLRPGQGAREGKKPSAPRFSPKRWGPCSPSSALWSPKRDAVPTEPCHMDLHMHSPRQLHQSWDQISGRNATNSWAAGPAHSAGMEPGLRLSLPAGEGQRWAWS